MIQLLLRLGPAAVATCAFVALPVAAHVLEPKLDRDLVKLRADIAKRVSTYATCIAKAVAQCESKGLSPEPECNLTSGMVAYEPVPGVRTAKFVTSLEKCEAKLLRPGKSVDYVGIGCPGDCDPLRPGRQPCANLSEYLAAIAADVGGEIHGRTEALSSSCESLGSLASKERAKCVRDVAKQLLSYRARLAACQLKCETDVKGAKGGGGSTNAPVCSVASGSAPFAACAAKAATSLKRAESQVHGAPIGATLDAFTKDLFNRADPLDPGAPAGAWSPCGTCGDSIREGGEECDGDDLGMCGACTSACTCAIDPVLDGPAGTACLTAFDPNSADYQPLCVPSSGSARHIRLEGVQALANNGYVYLAMGFPAVPGGNPATSEGDGRFIFTGGKSVSCETAWSYFRYAGVTDPPSASLCATPVFGAYHLGPQTVCLDVTEDAPPRVTLWASGANGADCRDKASLTSATALFQRSDWGSSTTAPVSTAFHFLKVNNPAWATMSQAAVSSVAVLP